MACLSRLLFPKLCVKSIADIDVEWLASKGITSVLLDLDNTLLPWKDSIVPAKSAEWVALALSKGMRLCIASNTHKTKRLSAIAEELKIECLKGTGKPGKKGLRRAMAAIGSTPENTAMVGDQIYTDIFGGNRLGMFTILVARMHPKEFFGTKISRLFEKPIRAAMRRRGIICPEG